MKGKKKKEATRELDIVGALSTIAKEKSVGMDLVVDSLKDALAGGARRYLGLPVNVEVEIDREKGTIEVYARRTVVREVEDPENEISLEEAKQVDPELEVGDELIQDLDIDMFGRSAIQTAKQVIVQRVREAERERVFEDYGERVGELVTGTVQQIDKGNILVNLGRVEAQLPYREQIRKERYRQGDTIRACIVEVRNNAKGPQVIISRTSPDFLARLFELEVPEIFDKTVRIVRVVRDPGHRSKIAVTTSDERVDPVGACVGMRGNRVQAIVRELSNERIDIINWTTELSTLVRRVFSPAEIKRVIPVGETKLVAVVREEDLAQAIGREGQNIRLASRLLDREIDVYGDEEFAEMTDEQKEEALAEPPEEIEEEGAEGEEAGGEREEGAEGESGAEAPVVNEGDEGDEGTGDGEVSAGGSEEKGSAEEENAVREGAPGGEGIEAETEDNDRPG